jgi:ABC-2 type transport system ATP-binding protein
MDGLGHRFGNKRVFELVSGEFESQGHGVILGANGSGKSTLGRIITGALGASEGEVTWTDGERQWNWQQRDEVVLMTLLMAPATALHPDLTVEEACAFHGNLRNWWPQFDALSALRDAGMSAALNKRLHTLSSGMKQRVQLTLALGTSSGITCLDEPAANLDQRGIDWYRELLAFTRTKTTTVICSNHRAVDFLEPDWVLELA